MQREFGNWCSKGLSNHRGFRDLGERMNGRLLHFRTLTFSVLLFVVFGKALFALTTDTSIELVLLNFALVFAVVSVLGAVLASLVSFLWKSKKIDFLDSLSNSVILSSCVLMFFYGFAFWRWNWPYNDQRTQPMYYENAWLTFLVGVTLIVASIVVWNFWARRLTNSKAVSLQGE